MTDLFPEYNQPICGIDEAGRGPLAGPVVAACVLLREPIDGLNDSKKLTHRKRELLLTHILEKASNIGIGYSSPDEIDKVNIRVATLRAMGRAFVRAEIPGEFIVGIDGLDIVPDIPNRQIAIKGGDGKVAAISAASIVAKVMRDWAMEVYDAIYGGYNFQSHKGYGTKAHYHALRTLGLSPIHRKTFIHL